MDKRLLALALLTIALYAPTVGYGFIYEDKNDLETFSRPWPLSGDVLGDAYRHPTRLLRDLSFAISGTTPERAHLGNVVLHIVNGLLVYAVAVPMLSPSGAVFSAGLFWLHPVQVESVAYISSRSDLVATMFLLLTILCRERVFVSLACALCAVLAKETFAMALVIPLVIGSWDRVNRVLWAVWALVAMPVFLGGLLMFGSMPNLYGSFVTLTQATVLLLHVLVPVNLTIDHDWALITPEIVFLTFCLWTVLAACAIWARLPQWSLALGAVLLFFLPRFVVPVAEGLHEHHLYAPMVALSMLFGSNVKGLQTCAVTSLH